MFLLSCALGTAGNGGGGLGEVEGKLLMENGYVQSRRYGRSQDAISVQCMYN